MAILKTVPVHLGNRFVWMGNEGIAEASELGKFMDRVYDDACDVGFIIQSHKTGIPKVFTLVEEMKTAEGETTGWRFKSVDGNCTAVVFND